MSVEKDQRRALLGLPRYMVAPQQVGILVQHEIRNPKPVEVVRLSDLTALVDAIFPPGQTRSGGDA